jgi:lysophospholipid acyltransferase (LPLAT)-like uncharacterized protein
VRTTIPLLKNGQQVAITPDRPRGPRRVAASEVAQIAVLSGVPVLPCLAQISHRHVLRTWDGSAAAVRRRCAGVRGALSRPTAGRHHCQ